MSNMVRMAKTSHMKTRKFKNFSCLACVYRVIGARRKFGEHDKDLREEAFYCDRVQNSHNAQKRNQTSQLAGQKHATSYTFVGANTFDPVNR